MVIETLALVCSWHPGREQDYNAVNPGIFLSITSQREWLTPHATVGAYIDSYKKLALVSGVGCDVGRDYGVGVTFGHVRGSGMANHPAVAIPALFYRGKNHGARIICSPMAFAFGYTYSFKP